MDVLRQFTGDPALPSPDKIIRHCWNNGNSMKQVNCCVSKEKQVKLFKDPFCLGSGSYPSLATSWDDFEQFLEPLPSFQTPKLLFAGEHTHPQVSF